MDKTIGGILGLTVIVFIGILLANGASTREEAEAEPRDKCVQHSLVRTHIHPELTITINGENRTIPDNLGITAGCMKSIHTHAGESGVIHIEHPDPSVEFRLADFFANWGETFSKDQILDAKVDETHRIRMLVNGQESTEFENLILRDKDKIEIIYEEK